MPTKILDKIFFKKETFTQHSNIVARKEEKMSLIKKDPVQGLIII